MIRLFSPTCDFAVLAADALSAPFQPVEGDSTLYRKELIYPGRFIKRNADGKVEFELFVDDLAMSHWVDQFRKMKAAGVEVPVAVEHTKDPERRRGTVEDLKVEPNPERGVNSLFMYSRFRDPEAAKMAATSGVSLYSEPSFVDGKDNKYTYPITHVALTDYPLIPGLQGWQAIAASLVPADQSSPQEPAMTPMQMLADEMGVTYPEGAGDDVIKQAIVQAWNAEEAAETVSEEITDEGMGEEMLVDEPLVEGGMMGGDGGMMGDGGTPPDDQLRKPDAVPASLAASFASSVKAVVAARNTQLDAMVAMRKITPARKKELAAKFATPQRVTFALSHGDIGDGFDDLILSLSHGPDVIPGGEKTPFQLQQDANGGTSAVEADAQRRAEAARKK